MALSDKKRQKKQEQKKQKRKAKLTKKGSSLGPESEMYAHYPIHECLIQEDIFEQGLGSLLLSRRTNQGLIAASLFLIDVFCLGIKNATFSVFDKATYHQKIHQELIFAPGGVNFTDIEPACVKKILDEARLSKPDKIDKPYLRIDHVLALRLIP